MVSALERLVLSYVAAIRSQHLAAGTEIVPRQAHYKHSPAVPRLLSVSELQRQSLLSIDHLGHLVKSRLNTINRCCWQDVYVIRAGEMSVLLIRCVVIFRDMKYPTEFHSDQIELYNISQKNARTLTENDYPGFDFPGCSTKSPERL